MILERIAGERFSRALPLWSERPVVLIATGPSLTEKQIAVVKAARADYAARVIAVNDAYLLAPWADVSYFADAQWFVWHNTGIPKVELGLSAGAVRERWASFPGEKCSIQSSEKYLPDSVHVLRNAHYPYLGSGLSLDPTKLVTGRNSGFQALNLAILAGAKTVILIGYDARPNAQGKTHFFGEHPRPAPPEIWIEIKRSFAAAAGEISAAGVKVWNCTPDSAIDPFEMASLDDVLSVLA
jgi:hypothetical protein